MTALHWVTADGPAEADGRGLTLTLILLCGALVGGLAVIGDVSADESLKASSNLADVPASEHLQAFFACTGP